MKLIPVYKHAMTQMDRRAPGATTINAVDQLNASKENGYQLPFNPRHFAIKLNSNIFYFKKSYFKKRWWLWL